MVFNKEVTIVEIEAFEKKMIEEFSHSLENLQLQSELSKKSLESKISIFHEKIKLNKYLSHIVIDVFNKNNERVYECDEPDCYLMLCEPLCFIRRGRIVGIDLCKDKEFLDSLNLLIQKIQTFV